MTDIDVVVPAQQPLLTPRAARLLLEIVRRHRDRGDGVESPEPAVAQPPQQRAS